MGANHWRAGEPRTTLTDLGPYEVEVTCGGGSWSGSVSLEGMEVFAREGAASRQELLDDLSSQAFSASEDAYSLAIGLVALMGQATPDA